MDEPAMIEWGKSEFQARQDDLKMVHAGAMSLEDAQKRAGSRQRQSGMTPYVAYHYMNLASRQRRVARS